MTPAAGLQRAVRLAFCLLVLLPLGLLLADSLLRDGALRLEAYSQALTPGALTVLGRTTLLALAATALAFALGGVAATILERRAFPCQGLLRLAALLPLVLPPFFHVAVLELLAAPGGFLATLLPFACEPGRPFPIRGFASAVWVLGLSHSPAAFFFVSEGLRKVPRELVDAARVTQPPRRVFWRIILPLAMPSILAGLGIVFTLVLLAYEVPRLLDVVTSMVAVQVGYGALADPGMALAAASPLLLLSAATLLSSQVWARRRAFALAGREDRELLVATRRPGVWAWLGLGTWWIAAAALPVAALGYLAGGADVFVMALRTDGEKIAWGAAVTLATSLGVCFSSALLLLPWQAPGRPRVFWAWLPLALPGALLGYALIRLGQWGPFVALYSSPLILVVAHGIRFLPVAVLLLEAHLRSVPGDEWDAASLVGGRARRWLRVRLPLAAPGLATGAVAVALLAASEVSATVLLAPPGREPVIVRIYNLLHYEPERSALAAFSLLHAAATLAVAAILYGAWCWFGGGRK